MFSQIYQTLNLLYEPVKDITHQINKGIKNFLHDSICLLIDYYYRRVSEKILYIFC